MQCRACGAPLPSNAQVCPQCGTKVSSTGQGQGGTPPVNDPQGGAPAYNPSLPVSNPYEQTTRTESPLPYPQVDLNHYQSSPYDQAISNSGASEAETYNQVPGVNPYQQQLPYNTQPYANNNNAYAQVPAQAQTPNYQMVPPPAPHTPYETAQRKKSPVGWIIGVVVVVLVVACIGTAAFSGHIFSQLSSNPQPTTQANTTTTNNDNNNNQTAPSGQPINSTAAQIINNVQSASAIANFQPVANTVGSTFQVNQLIYVTFQANPQSAGYAQVKFYLDNNALPQGQPLQISSQINAYFSIKYYQAGQGAAELYWCTDKNCSNPELAQVIHFTITN
jgi:hypothetical protein